MTKTFSNPVYGILVVHFAEMLTSNIHSQLSTAARSFYAVLTEPWRTPIRYVCKQQGLRRDCVDA